MHLQGLNYRIGVDVGGTNTDAVLFCADPEAQAHNNRGIIASVKKPTTTVVSDGIEAAIKALLDETQITPSKVSGVMIGNAVVEADSRKLSKVAVVRLGAPYTQIDTDEIKTECQKIKAMGLKAIAIVGICSPLDKTDFGLLERENASILNASIMAFAQKTISGFRSAISRLGLSCPLFLTQNDGTLTSAESAERLPIRTFSSGATNSMRGAAYLAGVGSSFSQLNQTRNQSIIVVDVGGTTTDVGVLLPNGLPRQAAAFIKVGGVRTNFSMPDVYSLGLGGGSRVHITAATANTPEIITVGPDSTGYQLLKEGIVFGGSTLTTTDIIAADQPSLGIGQPENLLGDRILKNVKEKAKAAIKKLLEDAIDRMKTTPDPATVILVGGGSIIAPEDLDGVGDTIEILQNRELQDVIGFCKAVAISRAVKAGAKADTVKVVEVENLPVQLDNVVFENIIISSTPTSFYTNSEHNQEESDVFNSTEVLELDPSIDIDTYVPVINGEGEWMLSETDLEWIAEGCGILGTGGGGSPYPPFIITHADHTRRARQIIRDGGTIRVISDNSLSDDDLVSLRYSGVNSWGIENYLQCLLHTDNLQLVRSPSVSNERIQAGTEIETACRNLMQFMNTAKPAAIISDEIGGGNGMQPLILASEKHLNVPVYDGDLMGRAYPLRNICTELGSKAGVSMAPLRASTCRQYGVTKSVSQAWRIGRSVAKERQRSNINGIPDAILQLQSGKVLFKGKIVSVQREWGSVLVMPLLTEEEELLNNTSSQTWHPDDRLLISFQNENLTAEFLPNGEKTKKLLAIVPDLITVLDSQSGSSLGTHEYRYGLRVVVIALASSPLWTTSQGLKYGGPAAFGLDSVYHRIAAYKEPVSVIEEYRSK
ncbi:hypothetical protein Clacol_005977 [Clathrus columnatus]|uniref:Hydantoinase n=1 Tax=Clathrus columnatus TaxID=1419009 RepID=A0AAV5AGC4_9AGAM|nr:hypothetical protein Clacol_005977 [Clathrus columnatus]